MSPFDYFKGEQFEMVDLNSMIWRDGIMFGCKACDYQTQKKAHVKRHLTLKHTPSANLVCEFCNSVYKNRIYLNRHKCRGNPLLQPMDPLWNWTINSINLFEKLPNSEKGSCQKAFDFETHSNRQSCLRILQFHV